MVPGSEIEGPVAVVQGLVVPRLSEGALLVGPGIALL